MKRQFYYIVYHIYMIIIHKNLGLKALLCLNGKCFDFKDKKEILWNFNCNR